MAIKKTSRKQSNPDQFDLFAQKAGVDLMEIPQAPTAEKAALDCKQAMRQALSAAIKGSGRSRCEIAATLSGWTGVEVSKDTIDMWTNPSHPSDLPAHFIAALTVILGVNFLDGIAKQAGCRVAGTEQLLHAQIGQMLVIKQYADAQILKNISDLPMMNAGELL